MSLWAGPLWGRWPNRPRRAAANPSRTARVAVVDIPNRYTSDVVLYRQTRVAHGGGMADSQPGGLVAGGMAD
jgi:hypothetical protein